MLTGTDECHRVLEQNVEVGTIFFNIKKTLVQLEAYSLAGLDSSDSRHVYSHAYDNTIKLTVLAGGNSVRFLRWPRRVSRGRVWAARGAATRGPWWPRRGPWRPRRGHTRPLAANTRPRGGHTLPLAAMTQPRLTLLGHRSFLAGSVYLVCAVQVYFSPFFVLPADFNTRAPLPFDPIVSIRKNTQQLFFLSVRDQDCELQWRLYGSDTSCDDVRSNYDLVGATYRSV